MATPAENMTHDPVEQFSESCVKLRAVSYVGNKITRTFADEAASSLYTDTIRIVVVDDISRECDCEPKIYTVHEDLICRHSTFFKAACSDKWTGDEEKVVHLDYDNAYTDFRFYVEWLYTKRTDLVTQIQKLFEPVSYTTGYIVEDSVIVQYLCRWWVLGDYLGDATFKNNVMDSLEGHDFTKPDILEEENIVAFITKNTNNGSALQAWLADQMVCLSLAKLHEFKPMLSESVLFEILAKYVAGAEKSIKGWSLVSQRIEKDKRKYHEHGEGEKCAKCSG